MSVTIPPVLVLIAQILGPITALSAVGSWAVGDTTLADLVYQGPRSSSAVSVSPRSVSSSTPPNEPRPRNPSR